MLRKLGAIGLAVCLFVVSWPLPSFGQALIGAQGQSARPVAAGTVLTAQFRQAVSDQLSHFLSLSPAAGLAQLQASVSAPDVKSVSLDTERASAQLLLTLLAAPPGAARVEISALPAQLTQAVGRKNLEIISAAAAIVHRAAAKDSGLQRTLAQLNKQFPAETGWQERLLAPLALNKLFDGQDQSSQETFGREASVVQPAASEEADSGPRASPLQKATAHERAAAPAIPELTAPQPDRQNSSKSPWKKARVAAFVAAAAPLAAWGLKAVSGVLIFGTSAAAWLGFGAAVVGLVTLDMMLFSRKAQVRSVKDSLLWTAAWVGLAMAFDAGVLLWRGPGPAMEFVAGYLIEKSLSVDNLFVFLGLFSYFQIKPALQHKTLFWGILGAICLRLGMIAAGATLLAHFQWVGAVFGAFLILTGIKMFSHKDEGESAAPNPFLLWLSKKIPLTSRTDLETFFTRERGMLLATPLLLALVAIEISDVIFALDSVPAVFGVSRDTFIIFTSNICAILGLRSLYSALAGSLKSFRYLPHGLAAILAFVGMKMLLASFIHIPVAVALAVVAVILAGAIGASLLSQRREKGKGGG